MFSLRMKRTTHVVMMARVIMPIVIVALATAGSIQIDIRVWGLAFCVYYLPIIVVLLLMYWFFYELWYRLEFGFKSPRVRIKGFRIVPSEEDIRRRQSQVIHKLNTSATEVYLACCFAATETNLRRRKKAMRRARVLFRQKDNVRLMARKFGHPVRDSLFAYDIKLLEFKRELV